MKKRVALFFLPLLFAFAQLPAQAQRDYVLGVFPYLPPRDVERVFAPMAADLGRTIHRHILLRSSTTYQRFATRLEEQQFDIAFIQPFDYVQMADRHGWLPLATRSEKLTAIVVTREDSPLKSVADLRGKTIALPPKRSAVSRLIHAYLTEEGLPPGKALTLTYHPSHVACMRQVLIHRADACGTAAPALRFFEHKMKVKLKTIAATRSIPHSLFAVSPHVPKAVRDALRKRIIAWATTEDGRRILARGRLRPFVPISNSAYNVVRTMAREQ